jgi:hypothetical protein
MKEKESESILIAFFSLTPLMTYFRQFRWNIHFFSYIEKDNFYIILGEIYILGV